MWMSRLAYSARVNRSALKDRARTGALALIVFALAHNLTFLVTYGGAFRDALGRTGHGPQWTATVALVAALAILLAGIGAVRLVQLARLAAVLDPGHVAGGRSDRARFAGHVATAWSCIFLIALLVFVVGENLEHIEAGLPAPGLAALGSSAYDATLLIFALVSLGAALVDALYRWRTDVLVARIAAARARWDAHRATARPDVPWVDGRHAAIVGHRIAGRAPPPVLAR